MPTSLLKQYFLALVALFGVFTEVVSAVKYQSQCRSCWAFSVTLAVSAQLVLTSGGSCTDLSVRSPRVACRPPARSVIMVVMLVRRERSHGVSSFM